MSRWEAAGVSHWELFPHEADMGVRGFGPTQERAFEQAALALTAVIADPSHIEPRTAVEVGCEAPDVELLASGSGNAEPATPPRARVDPARCTALHPAKDPALACAAAFLQAGSLEDFIARLAH